MVVKLLLGQLERVDLLLAAARQATSGLVSGLLPGEVVRFDVPAGLKVPHMGWNTVRWRTPAAEADASGWYYFVHSYYARPDDESVVTAVTDYGGDFCAAVARGRLFATQFHPEKSQTIGLRLLASFIGRD